MKMGTRCEASVDALPRDGATVVVTMHDQNGKYYITDVKPAKVRWAWPFRGRTESPWNELLRT